MRVSPAAFLNRDDLDAALLAADKVTVISHDHPEGIKGARATTHAIYLAFRGENPTSIREVITAEYGYDLTQTVDDIRPRVCLRYDVSRHSPTSGHVCLRIRKL